jgi:hypothetical protein
MNRFNIPIYNFIPWNSNSIIHTIYFKYRWIKIKKFGIQLYRYEKQI